MELGNNISILNILFEVLSGIIFKLSFEWAFFDNSLNSNETKKLNVKKIILSDLLNRTRMPYSAWYEKKLANVRMEIKNISKYNLSSFNLEVFIMNR